MKQNYLLSETSPLRRMAQDLDESHWIVLNGIAYGYQVSKLSYKRLYDILKLVPNNETPVSAETFVHAVADSWAIIDSVDRIRQLLQVLEGAISTSYSKEFIEFSKPVRELRNEVQHLWERKQGTLSNKDSAWGSISWVVIEGDPPSKGYIHSLIPGSINTSRKQCLVNPAGKEFYDDIDQITLQKGGHSICISDLMREVDKFISFFEKDLAYQWKGKPTRAADFHLMVEGNFGDDYVS